MTPPTIIALSGLSGAGKSSVAKAIKELIPGSAIRHFAYQVKMIAEDIFEWDGVKDDRGRRLLEALTVMREEFDPGGWARDWRKVYIEMGSPPPVIIVDDERGVGGPDGAFDKMIEAHGDHRFTILRDLADDVPPIDRLPGNLHLRHWDMLARAAGIPIDNNANDNGAAAALEIWAAVKAKMETELQTKPKDQPK